MRKLFTLIIIILTFVSLQAQIKKGSIFLGGDLGGATQKIKSADTTYGSQNVFYLSPVFGKAIKDNLIVGGYLNFSFFENNYISGSSNEYKSYGGGAFLRKYKSISNSGLFVFVQGNLGYSFDQSKTGGQVPWPSDDTRRNTFYVSAYPGLSYKLSRKLHLETGFNNLIRVAYTHEKRVIGSPTNSIFKSNGIILNSSLNNFSSLYLGFRLLIGK